ncbi:MAG: GNAT family N-acetyltransferase [Bacteroidota bacterium]|nr:GNAT family N-acetyltransferase [Bacteroidota bacterium]
MAPSLTQTNSSHPHFVALVKLLDQELAERDGDEHAFYARFNSIDSLKHCLVAYLNHQPVACGAFKAHSSPCTVEIKRMYVAEEHRGKGIAGLVLKGLEDWAHNLGFTSAILETGKRQHEAVALYTKNGYGRIPNYGQYEGVTNSLCFRKELSSSLK